MRSANSSSNNMALIAVVSILFGGAFVYRKYNDYLEHRWRHVTSEAELLSARTRGYFTSTQEKSDPKCRLNGKVVVLIRDDGTSPLTLDRRSMYNPDRPTSTNTIFELTFSNPKDVSTIVIVERQDYVAGTYVRADGKREFADTVEGGRRGRMVNRFLTIIHRPSNDLCSIKFDAPALPSTSTNPTPTTDALPALIEYLKSISSPK